VDLASEKDKANKQIVNRQNTTDVGDCSLSIGAWLVVRIKGIVLNLAIHQHFGQRHCFMSHSHTARRFVLMVFYVLKDFFCKLKLINFVVVTAGGFFINFSFVFSLSTCIMKCFKVAMLHLVKKCCRVETCIICFSLCIHRYSIAPLFRYSIF